jgi:hypothetical protein
MSWDEYHEMRLFMNRSVELSCWDLLLISWFARWEFEHDRWSDEFDWSKISWDYRASLLDLRETMRWLNVAYSYSRRRRNNMQSGISDFPPVWSRFFWSIIFISQFGVNSSAAANIFWSLKVRARVVRRWFRNFFSRFLIDEEFFSCCRISWFRIVFLSITNVTFTVRSEFRKLYTQRFSCTFDRFNLVVFAYTLFHSSCELVVFDR